MCIAISLILLYNYKKDVFYQDLPHNSKDWGKYIPNKK